MSKAYITVGLGYGDEGKGTIVDALVREKGAREVIRYNGGAQAAHNVVDADGRHHTFSQLGSGSFVPGVHTYLSRFMLVNPFSLFLELETLKGLGVDALDRVCLSSDALITTPFHVAANRLRELGRGQARHGSCGLGIGETQMDANNGYAIYAHDLHNPKLLKQKLEELRERKRHELAEQLLLEDARWHDAPLTSPTAVDEIMEVFAAFAKVIPMESEHVYADICVFEAAQGVLLDERAGFHPHTTWSTTTPKNAHILLEEAGWAGEREVIGITRSYMTRHGAGPMVSEDKNFVAAEYHNGQGEWQGSWRVGHADVVALAYAADICKRSGGLDSLAITHMDYVDNNWQMATAYETKQGTIDALPQPDLDGDDHQRQEQLTNILFEASPILQSCDSIIEAYEQATGVGTSCLSAGPTYADKMFF